MGTSPRFAHLLHVEVTAAALTEPNDVDARPHSTHCSLALAELKARSGMKPSVKESVAHGRGEAQQPLVTLSTGFALYYDDLAPGPEISLYAEPSATRFRDDQSGVSDHAPKNVVWRRSAGMA